METTTRSGVSFILTLVALGLSLVDNYSRYAGLVICRRQLIIKTPHSQHRLSALKRAATYHILTERAGRSEALALKIKRDFGNATHPNASQGVDNDLTRAVVIPTWNVQTWLNGPVGVGPHDHPTFVRVFEQELSITTDQITLAGGTKGHGYKLRHVWAEHILNRVHSAAGAKIEADLARIYRHSRRAPTAISGNF